jgi:WD40 repeat protein
VFSPDETLLVTSSLDGTVRLWDVATGEQVHEFEVGEGVIYADFSPDGQLITASDTVGFAYIWDVATKSLLRRLTGHTATIWTALFSPDGTQIVTSGWDGTARIWDVASGEAIRILDNGRDADLYWAEFSPDGQFVVTGAALEDRVDLWRVNLDDVIASLCARNPLDLTPEERTQYGITDSDPICPPS